MHVQQEVAGNNTTFLVTNIQRYSINDGPGIRTTVFLKGCPLQCAWCHNPEAIRGAQEFFFNEEKCARCGACAAACPESAISPPVERKRYQDPKVVPLISSAGSFLDKINDGSFFSNPTPSFGTEEFFNHYAVNVSRLENAEALPKPEMSLPLFHRDKCTNCLQCVDACPNGALHLASSPRTLDEVWEEVLADQLFYESSGGGLTISGGEPLLQPAVTLALLQRARKANIHTTLDTTGFVKWKILAEVLPYVDLVLFDVKLIDEVKHKKWTGVSNQLILENLRKIAATGTKIRIRCVIVHNVNYWDPDYPRQIVELAKSLGDSVAGIDIIPYHNFAESKYERLGLKYVFKGFPNLFPEDVEEYREIMEQHGPWRPTIGGIAAPETSGEIVGNRCWAG